MASIAKRANRSGSVAYDVRYKDPSGKHRSKSFRRRIDAEQFRAKVMSDMARGDWVDPERGKAETVGVWAEKWVESKKDLRNTRNHASILKHHLLPRWGSVPLAMVSHDDVLEWLEDARRKGLSASSRRKIRDALAQTFRLANRSGAVRGNPAEGIVITGVESVERRFLSAAQVELLATTIADPPRYPSRPYDSDRPDLGCLVRFAAYTGLRRGEILALKHEDLDLDARRVSVVASKTPSGRRRVPLVEALVPHMREQVERSAGSSWVFPNRLGHRMDGDGFYKRHYRRAVERAELGDVRFHDLRHTFAALMIDAGARPMHLKAWMGHSSIMVTFDIYGHLLNEDDPAVFDALDRSIAEVSG